MKQNTEQAQEEQTDGVWLVLSEYDFLGIYIEKTEAEHLADERRGAYGTDVDVVPFAVGETRGYSIPMRDWLDNVLNTGDAQ
ncbi:hypothetical protein NDI76_02155 [Halogeometricum sp. S1BR25-6]|uniref:Uncharacterized protein n=1 Tax=Halogeometricum salsisoli TaxID=2950536 RepID=A0ABU2GB50_9EURY|nr:hypothetical protein [Halogeometricum sp. S1BR25-6]MDS0297544.1 hypothetical protein [Halogeometricum sp. S1BR25-6]